jgi:hypothetical protein
MRPPYSQMSLVHPLVRAVGDSLAVSCIGMGTIEDRPLEEAVLRANVAEATLASTSICVTWVCGSHKPLLWIAQTPFAVKDLPRFASW